MAVVSLNDYRALARRRLPRMVYDYVEGGAEGEHGLTRNIAAFEALTFSPRRLVDVRARSSETTLWGRAMAMPVYVSPMGLNGLLWPEGDAALARAAGAAGIPFALSTASNLSIEEVAETGDGEKWFQLYVVHDDIAATMCNRAAAAGYQALILTVDVPVNGYRERDMRSGFSLPLKYTPRVMLDGLSHPRWLWGFLRHGAPKLRNFETLESISLEAQAALMRREMDAGFDFDNLARLRDRWKGRLMVKGLSRAEDVARCAALGVDAVIVSNHGARQLDGAAAPVSVLEAAVAAADIPVFMDGGVRRGADVLKALCLGAGLVGLGRMVLYALATAGEEGVTHALTLLKDEIDRGQALLGAPTIAHLTPDLIHRPRS